jgi:hypothetical protein
MPTIDIDRGEFSVTAVPGALGTAGEEAGSFSYWLDLRGWIVIAWVLWWSHAYFQNALAHRFPQLLTWTRSMW